jgi:hypothetical protein
VLVGALVQRSYSMNDPVKVVADPQQGAMPISELAFHPIDLPSYTLGLKAPNSTKTNKGPRDKPRDWTSYWLGVADQEPRAKGHWYTRSRAKNRLHDDQRCIFGVVLTVKDSAYAETKGASGVTFLCSFDTVYPQT